MKKLIPETNKTKLEDLLPLIESDARKKKPVLDYYWSDKQGFGKVDEEKFHDATYDARVTG